MSLNFWKKSVQCWMEHCSEKVPENKWEMERSDWPELSCWVSVLSLCDCNKWVCITQGHFCFSESFFTLIWQWKTSNPRFTSIFSFSEFWFNDLIMFLQTIHLRSVALVNHVVVTSSLLADLAALPRGHLILNFSNVVIGVKWCHEHRLIQFYSVVSFPLCSPVNYFIRILVRNYCNVNSTSSNFLLIFWCHNNYMTLTLYLIFWCNLCFYFWYVLPILRLLLKEMKINI